MSKDFEWTDELVIGFRHFTPNANLVESPIEQYKNFYLNNKKTKDHTIISFNGANAEVKNSLGETIKIGMHTNHGTIEHFVVIDGTISACFGGSPPLYADIDSVQPEQFVTEDGFPIRSGEIYTTVNKSDFITGTIKISDSTNWRFLKHLVETHLVFNDKSAAEKFAEENKPHFSKKQICEAIKNSKGFVFDFEIQETYFHKKDFEKKLGL